MSGRDHTKYCHKHGADLERRLVCPFCLSDESRELEALRVQVDILATSLKTLVDLKRYKDEHGKDAHYQSTQPVAWEQARRALEGHR